MRAKNPNHVHVLTAGCNLHVLLMKVSQGEPVLRADLRTLGQALKRGYVVPACTLSPAGQAALDGAVPNKRRSKKAKDYDMEIIRHAWHPAAASKG